MLNEKWRCDRCFKWSGMGSELLSAPNPFVEGDTLYACPECFTMDRIFQACDEPGCWNARSCGTPTPDGYRQTCDDHRPKPDN